MSVDYHKTHAVSAAPARSECEQCGGRIDVGSPMIAAEGVYEGMHYTQDSHVECEDAAIAYAHLHGLWGDEFPLFQYQDEDWKDRAWMREHHPIVAARLGWDKPEEEA